MRVPGIAMRGERGNRQLRGGRRARMTAGGAAWNFAARSECDGGVRPGVTASSAPECDGGVRPGVTASSAPECDGGVMLRARATLLPVGSDSGDEFAHSEDGDTERRASPGQTEDRPVSGNERVG